MNGFTLTWLAFALVMVVFGARAWVVETNRGRFTTGGAAQRGLTVAAAASVVLLVLMLTFNGGTELVSLLINGDATTGTPADGAEVATAPQVPGGAPAPAAPAPAPANP